MLNSVIGKLLSVFRTTWVCEFLVSNYRESKHWSNISDENLMSRLRCAVNVNNILDFKSLIWKKSKISHFFFILSISSNDNSLDILG